MPIDQLLITSLFPTVEIRPWECSRSSLYSRIETGAYLVQVFFCPKQGVISLWRAGARKARHALYVGMHYTRMCIISGHGVIYRMIKSSCPSLGRDIIHWEVSGKKLPVHSETVQTFCRPPNTALLSVSSVLMGSSSRLPLKWILLTNPSGIPLCICSCPIWDAQGAQVSAQLHVPHCTRRNARSCY